MDINSIYHEYTVAPLLSWKPGPTVQLLLEIGGVNLFEVAISGIKLLAFQAQINEFFTPSLYCCKFGMI